MKELGHHLCLGLVDRRVLTASVAQRRLVARSTLRIGRDHRLLAFRAADTHLHVEALCDRRSAGRLARRLELSLHKVIGYPVAFEPARIWPIKSQRHLYNAARYILRQDERHGVDIDPWAEASNLPDLLGLRVIGRHTTIEVGRCLPRMTAAELTAIVGLKADQLTEGDHWIEAVDQLADATAAAVALPQLRGRAAEVVVARRAAAAVTREVLDASALAAALCTSERTARRLRAESPDPLQSEAIRRQLRLRACGRRSG